MRIAIDVRDLWISYFIYCEGFSGLLPFLFRWDLIVLGGGGVYSDQDEDDDVPCALEAPFTWISARVKCDLWGLLVMDGWTTRAAHATNWTIFVGGWLIHCEPGAPSSLVSLRWSHARNIQQS